MPKEAVRAGRQGVSTVPIPRGEQNFKNRASVEAVDRGAKPGEARKQKEQQHHHGAISVSPGGTLESETELRSRQTLLPELVGSETSRTLTER